LKNEENLVKMMESAVMNEEDWPSLAGEESSGKLPADEDWEMLQQHEGTANTSNTSVSFELVDEVDKDAPTSANQQHMRHCMSTPNFIYPLDEESSYSMVSASPSVVSAFTSGSLSFRDAMLLQQVAGDEKNVAQSQPGESTIASRTRRPRIQPIFVVVAPKMKRCTKSTGDLQSLTLPEDQECNYGAAGACDAMEFYNRKAAGESSRCNGLKLRPDEAKRREWILDKKERQRQGAAAPAPNNNAKGARSKQ
jgi:hypothetical protein